MANGLRLALGLPAVGSFPSGFSGGTTPVWPSFRRPSSLFVALLGTPSTLIREAERHIDARKHGSDHCPPRAMQGTREREISGKADTGRNRHQHPPFPRLTLDHDSFRGDLFHSSSAPRMHEAWVFKRNPASSPLLIGCRLAPLERHQIALYEYDGWYGYIFLLLSKCEHFERLFQ